MSSSRVLRAVLVGVILALALIVRLEHNSSTPYTAVNDAGTYNRLGSMVAQHGDYATGDAPGDGVVGSRGPDRLLPARVPLRAGGGGPARRPSERPQGGDRR